MTEIILGPPGTGKTTTLLNIVDEELARGVAPDKIGFVTFTRRGAEEAISRAHDRFKIARKDLRYFKTLHSLSFRWLGLTNGSVFEGQRVKEFAEHVGVKFTGRWSDDGTMTGFEAGDRMLFMENLARVRGITLRQQYDEDHDELPWSEVDRIARAMHEFKEAEGLHDYTDMLSEFVRAQPRLGLEVLLVDEAQDLSHLQWQVVEQLAVGARRVVIGGDDDQAIYRWAGADADHLIDMPGDVRVLGQSWRVPQAIQRVANRIISPVAHRREKTWAAKDEAGEEARVGHFADAEIDGPEVLVLVRNAYVMREQVEESLRRRGIVYEKYGHPSIKMSVLAAITDWESLRAGKAVLAPQVRDIYQFMTAGAGVARGHKTLPGFGDEDHVTLDELKAKGGLLVDRIWHEALDRLPRDEMAYILAARRRGEKLTKRPRVRLSTIHASKGGEAEHVVLLQDMAWRTHLESEKSPDDERRVWYVAATRAKQKLTVVTAQSRQSFEV